MADFMYTRGIAQIVAGTINLTSDTIKLMLVDSGYTPDIDDDYVDAGGANDPVDHELTGTGYAAGWGGSGRKTLASKTFTVDDANNRMYVDAADVTWTAINAGTIAYVLMIKEGGADDTDSVLIACFDVANTVTNGGDVTFNVNSGGLFRAYTV